MKYDEYPASGLPFATGVIQGVYRHLVRDRLERIGVRVRQRRSSDAQSQMPESFRRLR